MDSAPHVFCLSPRLFLLVYFPLFFRSMVLACHGLCLSIGDLYNPSTFQPFCNSCYPTAFQVRGLKTSIICSLFNIHPTNTMSIASPNGSVFRIQPSSFHVGSQTAVTGGQLLAPDFQAFQVATADSIPTVQPIQLTSGPRALRGPLTIRAGLQRLPLYRR
jgi:hypothetical protein